MPTLWLFVVATLAVAQSSVAQERSVEPLARQVTTNLTLKIPLGSCTVPQMAALIARLLEIPSGIEQLPGPCTSPEQPMTDEIPLVGVPFQDVLDLLIKVDSRYYWAYSDGVIVVRPLDAWKKRDHFLHDTLQSVHLKEQNIGPAMDQIFARPGRVVESGELHLSNDPTLVTLALGPVSRIEALDALARAHGHMRWEVSYCLPETESDVATVWLYTYEEGAANPRTGLGCARPIRARGKQSDREPLPGPEIVAPGSYGAAQRRLGFELAGLGGFGRSAPKAPRVLNFQFWRLVTWRGASVRCELLHDSRAEQPLEPLEDQARRALHLSGPMRVSGPHVKNTRIVEPNARDPVHPGPDRGAPREFHLLGAERRLANRFCEHRRDEPIGANQQKPS